MKDFRNEGTDTMPAYDPMNDPLFNEMPPLPAAAFVPNGAEIERANINHYLGTPDVDAVLGKAMEAFWATVAEHYPQAQTGDISPGTEGAFELVARAAVEEWVAENATV